MFTTAIGLITFQTDQEKVMTGVASTINITGFGSELMSFGSYNVKYKSDADGNEEPGKVE